MAIALLFYCLKHRPLSYCNLYPRYDEKAEKGNKAWPKWTVICLSHMNTLSELNFAPGKIPLTECKGMIFWPISHLNTPILLQNSILYWKHLNILKSHCIDHIRTNYIHMLVKIKEILSKCIFVCPTKLAVPIYTTFTQYRLYFWFKFSFSGKVSRQ